MAGYLNVLTLTNEEEFQQSECASVFQCENCRTILGDSSTLIQICEPLAFIIVREMQPLQVRICERFEKSDSTNPLLAGSLFQRAYCIKCSQEVGRKFKNLPSHLSKISGHISLDINKISSYEMPNSLTSHTKDIGKALSKIQNEISKIQVVIINMNQRLESLESTLAMEEEASE